MNAEIHAILTQAIAIAYPDVQVEPEVSHPDPQHGDVATNVGFQLAKQLRLPPATISIQIAAAISHSDIKSAEAAGGYINMRMSQEYWLRELRAMKPGYGSSNMGAGQKVQVEFISANPTGPLTIGNARGGFIGDTLARVLQSQGYDVTREYYFNNAGTQIGKLLESVKFAAGLIEVADEDLQYRGQYIQDLAREFKEELETKSDTELRQLVTQSILKKLIKPALAKMGITFDVWFNEQELIENGSFLATMNKLRDKGLIYEKDGATWLDTAKIGVAREARVIMKSNGDPTYLAPDIAYHDDIFGRRGFDIAIKVLGADHFDQFPSVKAAVLALHPDVKLEIAGHQWFRLLKDGKEVKVSKRLGQFVTIEELIDEVGADVARFMTLQRSADTSVDFDLGLAKEQSAKNPLYYMMYSYARAHSIMTQAEARKVGPLDTLTHLEDVELALVRHMSRLPELVGSIADTYEVHRLTFYGVESARLFHDLYESERIIDLDRTVAARKLYVIARFIMFMESYFKMLGVTPVTRMERVEVA